MSFTAPVPIAAPIDELREWLRAPAGDASPADKADASALLPASRWCSARSPKRAA